MWITEGNFQFKAGFTLSPSAHLEYTYLPICIAQCFWEMMINLVLDIAIRCTHFWDWNEVKWPKSKYTEIYDSCIIVYCNFGKFVGKKMAAIFLISPAFPEPCNCSIKRQIVFPRSLKRSGPFWMPQVRDCSGSNAVWFLRLNQKRWYSFCMPLSLALRVKGALSWHVRRLASLNLPC